MIISTMRLLKATKLRRTYGYLTHYPPFPPSPSGIEREVLRAMPKLTLGGSAAFLLPAVLMRLWYGWSWPLSGEQALISTDIFFD